MEDNTSKLETPRYPDLGEDASHRRSAKLDFEAVKKLDKQIALDLILRNPDMTLKEKQDMIQAISNDRDDLDLVYDRRKQSELTGDIKKEADIFL